MSSWLSNVALVCTSNLGTCPICERKTLFLKLRPWLRDHYLCAFCRSIPRQRALIRVLQMELPIWRALRIYESSPGGPASRKLRRECADYVSSQYFPDLASGEHRDGVRCENLEKTSFPDGSFDVVITQDVFEHVMHPAAAFAEIARILKRGGAHVFTVPLYKGTKSVVRAVETSGGIQYLREPVYHQNPVDERGSLVVTDWGDDLLDFIEGASGMKSTIHLLHDPRMGLEAELLEVFVSRKRGT